MCYCTLFALFYFEFEGNFQVQAPGVLYSERRFNRGFFCVMSLGGLNLEGLIYVEGLKAVSRSPHPTNAWLITLGM